jgi:hypothetical protein
MNWEKVRRVKIEFVFSLGGVFISDNREFIRPEVKEEKSDASHRQIMV